MTSRASTADMRNESIEEERARKGAKGGEGDVPDWLDVKKQLTFYASYHSHPINIAIHVICIPLILWSLLALLAHVPLSRVLPANVLAALPKALTTERVTTLWRGAKWTGGVGLAYRPSLAALWIGVYQAYYLMLDFQGGLTYLPVSLLSLLSATSLATSPSHPRSIRTAWLVHGASWVAQFIGHGAAEGRAPALLDNLLQAIVLAPFFAHLEVMFMLFNFKPQLQRAIAEGAKVEKAKFEASRKGKRTGRKLE